MIIAIPVGPEGAVGHSWGKASRVAVAAVRAGRIDQWQEHQVGWDVLHDEGTHGAHHARVVRFLRENGVQAVVVDHVGDGMRRTLGSMAVALHEGARGPARDAVLAAAAGSAPTP